MKPRVVYWNNMPTPYVVDRSNAIADHGVLDFEAWFSERRAPDRSWDVNESAWRFTHRYLPSVRIAGRHLRFPTLLLASHRPDLLVSLYAEPSFLTGWAIAKARGIKTAFWVEGTYDRWTQRRAWKEAFKRKLFPLMDGLITTGPHGRAFCMRYGAEPAKIFIAGYATDIEYFSNAAKAFLPKRDEVRRQLGLSGVTFIYVGRLWWGKGVRFLLDAFAMVQRRLDTEVSLLLLGDGDEEALLRDKCKREMIRNVIFAGFKQKADLPRFYAASDVFVFPTLGDPYGLVVDEAMACALPVISTTEAGEIEERVHDGVNGYIVPPENAEVLAQRMAELALDASLRERMGRASFGLIQGNTPERWAKNFERAALAIIGVKT